MLGFTANEIKLLLLLLGALFFSIWTLRGKISTKSLVEEVTEKLIYKNILMTTYLLGTTITVLLFQVIYMDFIGLSITEKDFYIMYTTVVLMFFVFLIPWAHGFINRKKIQDKSFHNNNKWGLPLAIVCMLSIIGILVGYFKI